MHFVKRRSRALAEQKSSEKQLSRLAKNAKRDSWRHHVGLRETGLESKSPTICDNFVSRFCDDHRFWTSNPITFFTSDHQKPVELWRAARISLPKTMTAISSIIHRAPKETIARFDIARLLWAPKLSVSSGEMENVIEVIVNSATWSRG